MAVEWDKGLSLINSLGLLWIGYKNYRWSRRHAPADLYERQKGISDAVMKFIADAITRGDTDIETMGTFLRETRDSDFYFKGNEVKKIRRAEDIEFARGF